MKKEKTSLFGGIIIGLLFLIGGTILLWWNEGNNVKNIKTIKDITENVVEIDSSVIKAENNGKLVATNGELIVENENQDTIFSVGIKTPYLSRIVEIYEWKETEVTENDTTKYEYKKVWDENLINSNNFKTSGYNNPTIMPYKSEDFIQSGCKVGMYELSEKQIYKLPTEKTLEISNVTLPEGYQLVNNYVTNSKNLNSPEIGDVRISWVYNDWTDISIMAKATGSTFDDYNSSSGKKVNMVKEGTLSSEQMIQLQEDSNNLLKWILRGAGALLIIMGYLALISPITKLASYIPLLGSIVNGALGFIFFLVGAIHTLIIISIAWIRFRPLIGIILIAVCILLVYIISKLIKQNKVKTIS